MATTRIWRINIAARASIAACWHSKGSRFQGRPILPSRPSPQDVNVRGQVVRAGVDLWHVGTDTAKGAIFAKLMADAGVDDEDQRFRFPSDLPDEFYQQLTAERYDTTKQRWVKPRHKRNEFLDTTVYAVAAACHPEIRIDKLRDKDWEKIETKVQPVIQDMFSQQNEPAPAPRPDTEQAATKGDEQTDHPDNNQQPAKPKRKKRSSKGGFVGGWK
ncbi:terminase gpA endonuclease subunit [Thiohalophilus sp.]|uniref:terminase gpA endonuclease subunit n=1 Tax=Thiohalophilus sp. TaxID=3028392 RepID=UPI002ACE2762|nr:terminase gpA endonuclease subunit [Thiohalophilus sp.]MDZ7804319.1 terminase gpA endonuclease subunit [Thiohalophilus sp.]